MSMASTFITAPHIVWKTNHERVRAGFLPENPHYMTIVACYSFNLFQLLFILIKNEDLYVYILQNLAAYNFKLESH